MFGKWFRLGAAIALPLLAISFYLDQYWLWIYLALLAVLASMILYFKQGFQKSIPILVFLLPLSLSVSLSSSVSLVVPSEFLLVVIGPIVLIELYRESFKLLKQYPWPTLWLLSFIVPIVASEMLTVSLKFFFINALYVLTFYYGIILWQKKGGEFKRLVLAFSLGVFPVLVLGLINYARYDFNPITISGIYEPFFYSHTFFGACMALISAYCLGKISSDKLWWLPAIVFGLAAFLSGSRAALWSMLFMLSLWALLQLGPRLRLALPLLVISLALALGGLQKIEDSFSYNKLQSYDPKASLVEKSMSVTNVQSDVSNIERLNRWVSALRMFEERPHWGFGPGTYQFTYIPFQEKKLENRLTVRNPDYPPEGSGGTAHSEILLQISENGWPSTLLFLIILARWFYLGFWPPSHQRKLILPLFLGLATYYFHMHFNNFLNQPAFAFLFWSFGAMLEQQYKVD